MIYETSMSLSKEETVNRVKHTDVEIKDGQYGMFKTIEKELTFIPLGAAVTVERIVIDIDTAEQILYLKSHAVNGHPISMKISREELTEMGVLNLVKYGLQVDKRSAPYLVRMIENLESEAQVFYSHHNLGFGRTEENELIFKGFHGFVYRQNKHEIISDYEGGMEIKPKGSYEAWKSMVERDVLGQTHLEIMIAAGVAGVLIDYMNETVNVENLLIHNIGESSTGKTTAGMLMISCGSSPDIMGRGMAFNFADTQNALISSFHSAYPALADEGSLVRYNPTNLLYNLSMGREKKRMNKSMKVSDSNIFHTAIVFTSEKSLLGLADENTGLLVRNIEFEGVQWTASSEQADRIKETVKNHYGFLVPMMAEVILRKVANSEEAEIFEQYNNYREELVRRAKDRNAYNSLTERGAKQSAVILLSAYMVREYLDIKLNIDEIMETLEQYSLLEDPGRVDIGLRAMEFIMQFVEGNRSKFIQSTDGLEMRECWGRIKKSKHFDFDDGTYSERSLYIQRIYFDKIMREGKFPESRVVLKRLRELKILDSEKDRFISKFRLSADVGSVSGYILRLKEGEWEKNLGENPFEEQVTDKDSQALSKKVSQAVRSSAPKPVKKPVLSYTNKKNK